MKAEEQTKLNETLVKVFKLTQEQLSTLYNEDSDLINLNVITEADEKRVAKFTIEKQQQLDRGIKEGARKIETAIKEKYDIESDVIGSELVDLVVQKQVEEATKAGAKDISKHPEYIKLEASIEKAKKEVAKEWEAKFEIREKEFTREKTFDKVKDRALVNLETRKPILPTDPKKAQVWKETYLNELRGGTYQLNDDGDFIVLDKEGKIMTDKHGNPVTFDEFEKAISDKYFEYPVADTRSSSGNNPPVGSHSGNGEVRTKADAIARLKDPKITLTDRKKFTELMETLKE
jgi:hypothetical protein